MPIDLHRLCGGARWRRLGSNRARRHPGQGAFRRRQADRARHFVLRPRQSHQGQSSRLVLPPVRSVKAGLDGSFTLPNLAPGGWIVCAEAAGYLDPCHWSTAPAFTAAAGQTMANAIVQMEQAYNFQIRVRDPQGFLASEGKAAGAVLQIGAHAPSGAFQRASLAGQDSGGRSYTVAIPLKRAAKLFVSGGAFLLSDDSGLQIANHGKVTAVTALDLTKPGAAQPAPVGFSVTGLEKP